VRHHETLVRHDFAVRAAEPKLGAVRCAHAAAVLAANAHIALARRDRVAARRRPLRQMLLLGEAAPNQFDRRIEHARQDEAIGSCLGHDPFSGFPTHMK
jgi:hypothetical protein